MPKSLTSRLLKKSTEKSLAFVVLA
jgi:hypothetical protein